MGSKRTNTNKAGRASIAPFEVYKELQKVLILPNADLVTSFELNMNSTRAEVRLTCFVAVPGTSPVETIQRFRLVEEKDDVEDHK